VAFVMVAHDCLFLHIYGKKIEKMLDRILL
jgi:hypothetical protein